MEERLEVERANSGAPQRAIYTLERRDHPGGRRSQDPWLTGPAPRIFEDSTNTSRGHCQKQKRVRRAERVEAGAEMGDDRAGENRMTSHARVAVTVPTPAQVDASPCDQPATGATAARGVWSPSGLDNEAINIVTRREAGPRGCMQPARSAARWVDGVDGRCKTE